MRRLKIFVLFVLTFSLLFFGCDLFGGSGSGESGREEPKPEPLTMSVFASGDGLSHNQDKNARCIAFRRGELLFYNNNNNAIYSRGENTTTTKMVASPSEKADFVPGVGHWGDLARCKGSAVDEEGNVYFVFHPNYNRIPDSGEYTAHVLMVTPDEEIFYIGSGGGFTGVTTVGGDVYVTGETFWGASENGFYVFPEESNSSSPNYVAGASGLNLQWGLASDSLGNLYAYSGRFAGPGFRKQIVRLEDPSRSPSLTLRYVDPFRGSSPLTEGLGGNVEDVAFTEGRLIVFNNSTDHKSGPQVASVTEDTVNVLFDASDVEKNTGKAYQGQKRAMGVARGRLFVSSSSPPYILEVDFGDVFAEK